MKRTRISLAVAVAALVTVTACGSGGSAPRDDTAFAGVPSPAETVPAPGLREAAPSTGPAPSTAAPATKAPVKATAKPSSKPSVKPTKTSKPSVKPTKTSKPSAKPSTRKPTSKPSATKRPSKGGVTLDDRCLTGRAMCVDKRTNRLHWVIDGKVRYSTAVRFGSSKTPTREGQFSLYWKSRDHWSTLYDTPMPYAMFFSGGQAVHYSADFAANGYNGASHGCVNVRDKALIAKLFDESRVGDKVVVYRSAK